jgi:hypothetical protein
MSFGTVVQGIAFFEHAVALARGTEDPAMSASVTVPAEDMRAAAGIALEIDDQVHGLVDRFEQVKNWPIFGKVFVRGLVERAADGTRSLVRQTRDVLARAAPGATEVSGIRGGRIVVAVQELLLALEPLEIIAGERTVAGSTFAGMDDAVGEAVLISLPVIGEAVLVFEAVVGREVVSGRHMSRVEQAAAGIAVILPYALGAVAKTAMRTVATVSRVTRRTIEISLEYHRVYSLLQTAKRAPHALQMAIGMRHLSAQRFEEFLKLLALVSRGDALTVAQLGRLTHFFVRMHDAARLAMWLRIVERELGPATPGFKKLKTAKFTPAEDEVLREFSTRLNEPVIGLPEVLPIDYPGTKQVPDVKYPDGIWRDELFDLVILETSSDKRAVGRISDKASQAPTVLVAFAKGSTLTAESVPKMLPRIFGNPNLAALERVVVFDGVQVTVHQRQPPNIPLFLRGLNGVGAGGAKRLSELARELEAE